MDFSDLKAKIDQDFKLDKPEFLTDTETTVNIGQIDLTTTQKLIFSVSAFRNKKYFDIRTWYQDDSGEWKPTKKGVHLSFDKYDDFTAVLKTFTEISELNKQ